VILLPWMKPRNLSKSEWLQSLLSSLCLLSSILIDKHSYIDKKVEVINMLCNKLLAKLFYLSRTRSILTTNGRSFFMFISILPLLFFSLGFETIVFTQITVPQLSERTCMHFTVRIYQDKKPVDIHPSIFLLPKINISLLLSLTKTTECKLTGNILKISATCGKSINI
jgi:hypothetical protein